MDLLTPCVKGKRVGNFDLALRRMVKIHTEENGEKSAYVEASLIFKEGSSKDIKLPLTGMETTDWGSLDCRVRLNSQFSMASVKRHIANTIKEQLDNLPVEEVYQLNRPGFYKINNLPVFCIGREAIRPSSGATPETELELVPMSQHLDYDPNVSEEKAAAEVLNLISLFPNPGRVILSQVLVSLMRQAYEDAGKKPSFCVLLYGPSGTQKTTIASFLTQIYNRSDGIGEPTRLNASRASAVEMLMDTVDQVKVFDDLFPSNSKQIRQKQEELLSEITRYVGDGTIPARLKGGALRQGRPKCGVLFTGEYLIGEGSDAARLLPVKMMKPDTVALRGFQERPLIVSTFYRNFIVWFVENYDPIVANLKKWLDEYRKTDLGVHDRLRETHFFLNTAYIHLLEYCGEKGFLDKRGVLQFQNSFAELLTQLVREQNERVSPTDIEAPTLGNVLERIRELYRGGEFSIPTDKKKFKEQQHDGVIHKDCLCLRPKTLSRFFPSSKIEDIVCVLDEQGALVKGNGDSPKRKISDAHGNSFYWIPLSCLS